MLLFLTECPPGVRLSGKLGLWTLTLAKVIYSGSLSRWHRDARRIAYLDPDQGSSFRCEVRTEYTETLRDPARAHAICEG